MAGKWWVEGIFFTWWYKIAASPPVELDDILILPEGNWYEIKGDHFQGIRRRHNSLYSFGQALIFRGVISEVTITWVNAYRRHLHYYWTLHHVYCLHMTSSQSAMDFLEMLFPVVAGAWFGQALFRHLGTCCILSRCWRILWVVISIAFWDHFWCLPILWTPFWFSWCDRVSIKACPIHGYLEVPSCLDSSSWENYQLCS